MAGAGGDGRDPAGTLAVPTGIRPAAMAAASGLLLAALALTGHAVMQDGWLGAAHRLNDAVHVLSASAWLGALVPLLLILKRLGASGEHRETIDALMRFSIAGQIVVALVVV